MRAAKLVPKPGRTARFVLILLACKLASGCVASTRTGEPLTPSHRPFALDVPIPSGFVLAEPSSPAEVQDGARRLRHRYEGKADKTPTRDFYRREMPLVRWTPTGEEADPGRYTLRFERGRETCTIEIVRRRGWSKRVLVNILIDPRPD